MNPKSPFVSIITVNFNNEKLTCELLFSLRTQPFRRFEIFVVDNGSETDPTDYILNRYPEVKMIRSEKNLGFAGGNNLAVKEAKGDLLFFINNDAEVKFGCLEQLVQTFDWAPNVGVVSPLICYYNENAPYQKDIIQYAGATAIDTWTARNKTIGEGQVDEKQFNYKRETAYAHGAAMMVKREVIEKVGMMQEDYFLYYEELDWCERIKKAGYAIYFDPHAKVYHKESMSVGKLSPLKTYYLNRNRILFMRRHQNWFDLSIFVVFLIFFTIPKNLLMFQLRGEREQAKAFIKALKWHFDDIFKSKKDNFIKPEHAPPIVKHF